MNIYKLLIVANALVLASVSFCVAQEDYAVVNAYNRVKYVTKNKVTGRSSTNQAGFQPSDNSLMDLKDLYAINKAFTATFSINQLKQFEKLNKQVFLRFYVDNSGDVVNVDFYFNTDPKISVLLIAKLAQALKKDVKLEITEMYDKKAPGLVMFQAVNFSKVINGQPIHDEE